MKLTKEDIEYLIIYLEEYLNIFKNNKKHQKSHEKEICISCSEVKKLIRKLRSL